MKKIIIFVVLIVCFNPVVKAQTYEFEIEEKIDLYSSIYEDFLGDEFENTIPGETFEFANDIELSPRNPFSFNRLFSKRGFEYLKEYVFGKVSFPFEITLLIISTILICAITYSISDNNSQTKYSLNTICVLSIITLIILPINNLISETINIINVLNSFMSAAIPIFAGILIATIKSGTASVFSSSMFFLCQTISNVSRSIILPFSNCYVALSVAQGISNNNKLHGITRMLRKCAYILISISMAVFISVLSLQTTISGSTDNIGTKTAKFFVSSFVPIIGPSLSESINGLRGCFSVLKSSVGIYVIIIILITILPIIFEIFVYKAMLSLCSDISDVYDIVVIRNVLISINQALSILLSIILCVSLMFVFSITIVFIAGKSV